MNIKKVIPCGYCKGVINAINLAKQTKNEYPDEDIYILGMIVQNHLMSFQQILQRQERILVL